MDSPGAHSSATDRVGSSSAVSVSQNCYSDVAKIQTCIAKAFTPEISLDEITITEYQHESKKVGGNNVGNSPPTLPRRTALDCVWPNGKAYFFKQYDIASDRVDAGFPRLICDGWPGIFTEDIDAVTVWSGPFEGFAYFFKGDLYTKFDIVSGRSVAGYPQKIVNGWPGVFTKDMDAVCVWPKDGMYEGKAYFFKGTEYTRFDIVTDRADPGYPAKITESSWPGLFPGGGIDAVCV